MVLLIRHSELVWLPDSHFYGNLRFNSDEVSPNLKEE